MLAKKGSDENACINKIRFLYSLVRILDNFIDCFPRDAYLLIKNLIILVIGFSIHQNFDCVFGNVGNFNQERWINNNIDIFALTLNSFVIGVIADIVGFTIGSNGTGIIYRSQFGSAGCCNNNVGYRALIVRTAIPGVTTPIIRMCPYHKSSRPAGQCMKSGIC